MNLSTLLKGSGLISSDRVLKRQFLWHLLCLVCGSTRSREIGIAFRHSPDKIGALIGALIAPETEALTAYFAPIEWFAQNRDRVIRNLPLSRRGITYQPGCPTVIDDYMERADSLKPQLFDAYLRVPICAIAYAVVVKESKGAIAAVAAKESAA